MNSDEEELQSAIEKGVWPEGEGPGALAYREVFRVLKKPAEAPLPAGFAERVAHKIIRRQKQIERRDYFWYMLGVVLHGVAAAGTMRYTGFRLDLGFLNALVDYKGLGVFAVVLIVFLNWLDGRFIRTGLGHGGDNRQ